MATLTVDLDDQATDALDIINNSLDLMGQTSVEAAKKGDMLTESQRQQFIVIQQQEKAFTKLGNTALVTLDHLGVAGIHAFEAIEVATEKAAASITNTMITAGASVLKFGIVTGGAMAVAKTVWGDHTKAVKANADATEETADRVNSSLLGNIKNLALMGAVAGGSTALFAGGFKAAAAAIDGTNAASNSAAVGLGALESGAYAATKTFSGLWLELTAAEIALKGVAYALAATGKQAEGTTINVKNFSWQAQQDFKAFQDEAKKAGMSLEELARYRGLGDLNTYLEQTFGVVVTDKYTTNLTKVQDAVGGFGNEVGRTFEGMGQVASNWWNEEAFYMQTARDLWKGFDDSVTYYADGQVFAFDKMTKATRSWVDYLSDSRVEYERGLGSMYETMGMMFGVTSKNTEMNKGLADSYNLVGDAARAQKEATNRVWASQEIIAASSEYMAAMYKRLGDSNAKRAEDERIASIKTVAQIDAESEALRNKMQQQQRAGTFLKNEKEDEAGFEALAKRRIAIVKENAKAQADAALDAAKTAEKNQKEEFARIDALDKKRSEVFEADRKRTESLFAMQADLVSLANKGGKDVQGDANKDQHEAKKQQIEDQMKLQADADAQVQFANLTGIEKEFAIKNAQRQAEQDIKQTLRQMDQRFASDAHVDKLNDIEDEATAKLKAIEAEAARVEKLEMDEFKREKENIRLKEEEAKVFFDLEKNRMAENAKFTKEQNAAILKDHMAAEQAKFDAERARIEKEKALNQKSVQGFDADKFGKAQDPNKVMKQVQENRAEQERQKQAKKDENLAAMADQGNAAAARRFKANQDRAGQRGRNSVMNDDGTDNVSDNEGKKAQAQVGQQTLKTLGDQGKVNSDQVQMMTDMLKTLADQQQAIANIIQFNAKLAAFQKGQKNMAQQQVTTTQNQQGGLN